MLKIILLLIMILPNSNQNGYELIETDSDRFNLLMENIDFIEICTFNSAFIYKTDDGKYIMTSSVGSKYALLYNDKKTLDSHIENKYFPVPFDDNILISENDNFKNIQNSIHFYENHLKERFNFVRNEEKTNFNNLMILNKKISNYDDLSKFDVISIGVVVSELFIERHNLSWKSYKIFTFNPSWYPIISSEDKEYDVLGRMIETYDDCGKVDIKHSYIRALSYFKNIKPLSKDYLDLLKQSELSDL